MTAENFVRFVWRIFEKIKEVEEWWFFGRFWVDLAMFLTSQSYNFEAVLNAGASLEVK